MAVTELSALSQSFLFRDLQESELKLLATVFVEKRVAEGLTVFVENMPGESLFLIREGTIRVSKMVSEADERTLVILGPEEVFGEMALLDGGPRAITARVIESARLLILGKDDFDALCERHPAMGMKLLRNIARLFSKRVRENGDDYREMLRWSTGPQT